MRHFALLLLIACKQPTSVSGSARLLINEVVVRPGAETPWVELYNAGDAPANLAEYALTGATLPNASLSPGEYVVVDHWAEGGVELLRGEERVDAVAFDWVPLEEQDDTKLRWLPQPGDTIGRNAASDDTDTAADWAVLGGRDAAGETKGARNLHPLVGWATGALPDTAGSAAPSRDEPAKARWTVMIFADVNDPAIASVEARYMEEVRKIGSDQNVRFVLQVGRTRSAARHEITKNVDWNASRITPPDGEERNPATSGALAAFITWAKTNYPANHYALAMIGHGNGWKGINVIGDEVMTMSELRDGLNALGQPFDVLYMHSCLMGMLEVGRQLIDRTRFWVASEEVLFANFEWKPWVEALHANPGMEPAALADSIANAYAAGMVTANERGFTIASIDLNGLAPMMTAVSAWATALKTDMADIKVRKVRDDNGNVRVNKDARAKAEQFKSKEFKDLRHLSELVAGLPLSAAPLSAGVNGAFAALVRVEQHGARHPNAHGLSIYFPKNLTQTEGSDQGFDDTSPSPHLYALDAEIKVPSIRPSQHSRPDDAGFLFPGDSTWDEFLHRFYKPTADACIVRNRSCVQSVTLVVGQKAEITGQGSSDGDPQGGGHIDSYWWDKDATVDNPADPPAYAVGMQYGTCAEDCDRDEADTATDDPDASGSTLTFSCDMPMMRGITLNAWDEHHHNGRLHGEGPFNQGRHWLHFNESTDGVSVECVPKQTSLVPTQPSLAAGEDMEYAAVIVPATGSFVSASVTLPAALVFESVDCPQPYELCAYDAGSHSVHYSGLTMPEGALVSIWTSLPAGASCTSLVAQGVFNDGSDDLLFDVETVCL